MTELPSEITIKAWIQLHRVHRKLLDDVETTLKLNKLPPLEWYDVLLELYREKETGLRQYEIGEKMLLSKHNLSRLIDRLEKKQLVVRDTCVEDGRGYQIKITKEGEKNLKMTWPVYGHAIQNGLAEKLSITELAELLRLLNKLFDK